MAMALEANADSDPSSSRCARSGSRPPARRRRWRLVAPVVAAVAIALACAACFPPPSPGSLAGDALNAMNRDRGGLGALAWDSQLAGMAQSHAQAMANSGSLWHSDLSWLIAQPSMAGTSSLGENLLLAPAGTSGAAAEAMWMGSAPHRANILNGAFNRVGIGVVTDGAGRIWMVALFGAR
jgi:uncharacterized protein YkwD